MDNKPDFIWGDEPRVQIKDMVYDAWEQTKRAHYGVFLPTPPRVAWWAIKRVGLLINTNAVVTFDGVELKNGDTLHLPPVRLIEEE